MLAVAASFCLTLSQCPAVPRHVLLHALIMWPCSSPPLLSPASSSHLFALLFLVSVSNLLAVILLHTWELEHLGRSNVDLIVKGSFCITTLDNAKIWVAYSPRRHIFLLQTTPLLSLTPKSKSQVWYPPCLSTLLFLGMVLFFLGLCLIFTGFVDFVPIDSA